ncbi:unnamed protein product, partial [Timema podura]|nr:unnamed protein product [Timema podura]
MEVIHQFGKLMEKLFYRNTSPLNKMERCSIKILQ